MKVLHDIHTHNVLSAYCEDKTASTAAYFEKEAAPGMKVFGLSNHLRYRFSFCQEAGADWTR